jgi:hypothetical protein
MLAAGIAMAEPDKQQCGTARTQSQVSKRVYQAHPLRNPFRKMHYRIYDLRTFMIQSFGHWIMHCK